MRTYTTKTKRPGWLPVLLALAALLVGCATPDGVKPARGMTATSAEPTAPPSFGTVSFSHAMNPVGDMVRLFGEQVGGGMVMMSGLEERAAAEAAFRELPYEEAVSYFAGAIDCTYFHTPYYYFILPEGYDLLRDTHLGQALDARYRTMTASVSFGAKTPLYQVFAALSDNLEITVVADNVIAEAQCGEMFLNNTPLDAILEAILRSARFTSDAFVVESTSEYIFIRAPQNTSPPSLLLNAASLDADQRALLDRTVTLVLPDRRAHAFMATPIPLRDALRPITDQLGVETATQRQLGDIPVNPCVMHQVRLETALALLIRQWPVPEFGYELFPKRILIRER